MAHDISRIPLRRLVFIALVLGLAAGLLVLAPRREAGRTTPVYEPPVLAGQPVSCTAGFYARRGETIVLTISDHCYDRAHPPLDAIGDPIGWFGADARRADCPPGRTCAGADIVELELAHGPRSVGLHLNLVRRLGAALGRGADRKEDCARKRVVHLSCGDPVAPLSGPAYLFRVNAGRAMAIYGGAHHGHDRLPSRRSRAVRQPRPTRHLPVSGDHRRGLRVCRDRRTLAPPSHPASEQAKRASTPREPRTLPRWRNSWRPRRPPPLNERARLPTTPERWHAKLGGGGCALPMMIG